MASQTFANPVVLQVTYRSKIGISDRKFIGETQSAELGLRLFELLFFNVPRRSTAGI